MGLPDGMDQTQRPVASGQKW